MIRQKKILAFLLSIAMIISLVPSGITVYAATTADTKDYEFVYKIYSETAHRKDAGTGSKNLYGKVYFYAGSAKKTDYDVTTKDSECTSAFVLTNSGDYEEASGSSPKTKIPPWRVSAFEVKNNSSNAYMSHWLKLYVEVYDGNKRIGSYQIGETYYPGGNSSDHKTGKWIDSSGEHAHKIYKSIGGGKGKQTRNPSTIDGWDAFGGTAYIDPAYSGNDSITVELPGTLTNDKYYGAFGKVKYNMFDWQEAARMSFKVSGTAADGSTVSESALTAADVGAFERIKTKNSYEYVTGYKINKKKLVSYMNKKGINKIDIIATLKFPWWTFDDSYANKDSHGRIGGDTYCKTYTIYRNAFEVWRVQYKSAEAEPYERNSDNKYFNNDTKNIKVVVDAYYYNNDSSNNSAEDRNNSWGHFTKDFIGGKTVTFSKKPKLQIGRDANNYIEAKSNKATFDSTSDFVLEFELPEGAVDSEDVGLTLIMEGVYFEANGQKYYLTDTQYDYVNPPSNDKRTKGNANYFASAYKVDNIIPTAEFTFNESEKEVNGWRKRAVLDYTVSEDLYTGKEDSDIATMNYRLRSKDKVGDSYTYYNITKVDGTGKTTVGEHLATESSGSQIIVAYADGEKEIDSVLELVNTTDIAGNVATAVAKDIKLDNQAPRVERQVKEGARATDGSKSTKYSFTVEDASESAKVYYAFTKGNDEIPEFNPDNVEEASGEVTNLIGKWAYVEQIPDNSEEFDTTNGTALLKVENGEFFSGRIHYFAEDGLGNKSDIKSEYISIANENTLYDITVNGNSSYPLKDYEIEIKSAGNKIYWRWQHPDKDGVIADFREYKTPDQTGSGTQKDDRDNEVILDGLCVLEIKIVTPAGTENVYTKELVFDNSAPSVGFTNANSGTYRSSQTITAKADDTSGIRKATAIIVNPDGTEIDGMEEFDLSVADGLLNDKITVTNVPAGAYAITVTAVDNNGYETTQTSNPFYIRNTPPEMALNIEHDKSFEDAPLFGENTYQMNISVKEAFRYASGTQQLYYRVSDSTQEYGAWTNAGEMTAAENGFELDFTADTPVKLVEGINNIYVQTIIAPDGVDPANLTSYDIIATESITVYYDTTAPQYRLNLTDTHTNEPITGMLEITDNIDGELLIDTNGISEDVLTVQKTDVEDTYTVTVFDNIDDVIYVTDAAGNSTEIAIKISDIDFEAPALEHSQVVLDTAGERTFASAEFYISNAEKGSVRFALIPQADKNKALNTDGTINEAYFTDTTDSAAVTFSEDITAFRAELIDEAASAYDNEANLTYKALLKGLSGKYYIGVSAEDSLGNTNDIIFEDLLLEVNDAQAEITEYAVTPEIAYNKAMVNVSFNVPVYVLPQSMITGTAADDMTVEETNLDNARKYAGEYSQNYPLAITEKGRYKLYTTDELGRTKAFELNITDNDVTFDKNVKVDAQTVVLIGEVGTSWLDFIEESRRVITGDELVASYVHNNQTEYTVIEVTPPSGFSLQPVTFYDEEGEETAWNDEEGIMFWEEQSEQYLENDGSYSKLVYLTSAVRYEVQTENGFSTVYPEKTERAIDVNIVNPSDGTLIPVTVFSGNIDNTPPQGTATANPVISRDEEGNPTNYTFGNVNAEVKFSDPQTGIESLQFWAYEPIEWEEMYNITVPFIDENGNAIDYSETPFTYEDDFVSVVINGAADIKVVKNMSITFKENATAFLNIENTVGEIGLIGIGEEGSFNIDYINKVDISESDYTVSYYYEDNNGEWQSVTDGIYYKNAKAVIEATETGIARGLYVANNGGNNEKHLDSFDRDFTFILSDRYGYKIDVPVELSDFDETAGEISYQLATTGKTNKPVDITIIVSDEQSGIGSVTLQRGEEDIELTDNGNGIYTGKVSNIGNHVITFTDKVGNIAQKVFMVADIDSTLPILTGVEYSDTERTSKTVSAALKYSKPDVTLTKVEIASGLTPDDYTVDYSASTIRFHESGTLSVWFTDSYGNTGADTVTVANIYKTPPALEAVMTAAENKMSVDVSFVKATNDTGAEIDTQRALSEVMVAYNGIVNVAEDAVYTFNENGVYTFKVYDDEGVASYVTIEITDIDKTAPKITQIRWSYDYEVLENGAWASKKAEGIRDAEDEAGYRIATDVNPITNEDVSVTVVTDSETTIMGNENSESSTEHTLTYSENGMYIFNMQKPNGLSDSYGFDVAVIDKTPPVIELVNPELIFYENPDSNPVQYSKDLLTDPAKAFRAYDIFGGETDLSDRVTIDFGNFNADDITQNTFDRTVPYTITYSVSDDAHNVTEAKMTIRLVGYYDTVALVNGSLPDYAGRKEVNGEKITISLKNFSGVSYARVEKGIKTMGQMKKTGTILTETSSGSGVYEYTPTENGWYTILVQTDKRDYFNLQVYVWK